MTVKRIKFIIEDPDGINENEIKKMRRIILEALKKEFPSMDWED